jgi:4-hydroxybenzoate polyprenyltransferase/phosphoserine phosphatase
MPSLDTTLRTNQVPLCVDLDGTLIRTDLLWESFVRLIGRSPLKIFLVPFWLLRGRAYLKRRLAEAVQLDPATLPYHHGFVEFLRNARQDGRRLILVTASDVQLASRVAKHLGLFDEVLGSDGRRNLRGAEKAGLLVERFGERGFDYAGNSSVDLPVWAQSQKAIVVNAGKSLADKAATRAALGSTFLKTGSWLPALLQAMRPHQWVKNLIVFVPLITAHQLMHQPQFGNALMAFFALCFCASAAYLSNDLLDLDADRCHPDKCRRPFASGEVPLPAGLLLSPLLLIAGVALGAAVNVGLAALLAMYFVVTSAYSLWLKRLPLLDVFVLAGLYTLRLIAGHVATGIVYSAWLLVFSMFIFLSLALLKRFKELQTLSDGNGLNAKGRGYMATDLQIVATLGMVSGYLAVLVLALYVNSPAVAVLYRDPLLLLLICPLFLYWISRVWLLAYRRQMHTDPVVFALTDRPSFVIGALTAAVLWLATGR